jgi:hypothetical protein
MLHISSTTRTSQHCNGYCQEDIECFRADFGEGPNAFQIQNTSDLFALTWLIPIQARLPSPLSREIASTVYKVLRSLVAFFPWGALETRQGTLVPVKLALFIPAMSPVVGTQQSTFWRNTKAHLETCHTLRNIS